VPDAYDRLPLGALRVFEAVATHLNFSSAAHALHVTPAAVSQQIKSLEFYIQVPLFRRNGRRVELTEEGLELLPRLRSFRRKHPEIDLRLHTSSELVDFSREAIHVGIRFGRGNYANLYCERLLDDWIVPVGTPELIKQHGMLERGANLSRLPLLESEDLSWRVWQQSEQEIPWQSVPPTIDDSAGLLIAAEEGLGFALARWTLVSGALQKGRLKLASREALPYGSAYYFVCPKAYLELPKVARFREWIVAAARDCKPPPGVISA
jgi:LysR family glycine cleavage system transcriptional activator